MTRSWLSAVILLGLTAAAAAEDLIGLWEGRRVAGPEVQGTLIIARSQRGWQAEIAGHRVSFRSENGAIVFSIPGGRGAFSGRLHEQQIVGHWTQPCCWHWAFRCGMRICVDMPRSLPP